MTKLKQEKRFYAPFYFDDFSAQINNPRLRKFHQNPKGLLMLLIRDACRGHRHWSPKCKKILKDRGGICAEYSLPALADKLGVHANSIGRWLNELEQYGMLARLRGDCTKGVRMIFEVGHLIRRPDAGETVEYYFNRPLHTPIGVGDSSTTKIGGRTATEIGEPPTTKDGDLDKDRNQDQKSTPDKDVMASASASPKPNAKKSQSNHIGSADKRSPGVVKTARPAVVGQEDQLRGKFSKTSIAAEVLQHFNAEYERVIGCVPCHRGSAINSLDRWIQQGRTLDEFKKVIDFYLERYLYLKHHKGDPALHRMLHDVWFPKLFTAALSGNDSDLFNSADHTGGSIDYQTLKEMHDKVKDVHW